MRIDAWSVGFFAPLLAEPAVLARVQSSLRDHPDDDEKLAESIPDGELLSSLALHVADRVTAPMAGVDDPVLNALRTSAKTCSTDATEAKIVRKLIAQLALDSLHRAVAPTVFRPLKRG